MDSTTLISFSFGMLGTCLALGGVIFMFKMLNDGDRERSRAIDAILSRPPLRVIQTGPVISCPYCGRSLNEQPDNVLN